jgi:hypothetical protein
LRRRLLPTADRRGLYRTISAAIEAEVFDGISAPPVSVQGHSRLARTGGRFSHVCCAPESGSKIGAMASAAMDLCGWMA